MAYINPPIVSPPTAPACHVVLLHVDAFEYSERGTICDKKAKYEGAINALARPVMNTTAYMGHTPATLSTKPLFNVKAHNSAVHNNKTTVARIIIFFRSIISAIWPANKAVLINGMASVRPIIPSQKGSLVYWYICQLTIKPCICVPRVINKRAEIKNLKSGKRSEAMGSLFKKIKYYK